MIKYITKPPFFSLLSKSQKIILFLVTASLLLGGGDGTTPAPNPTSVDITLVDARAFGSYYWGRTW